MTDDANKPDWQPLEPDESRAQIDEVLALLEPKKPASVLDLGCGSGRILAPLARAGHEIIGIDSDPDAHEACRQILNSESIPDGRVKLIEADYKSETSFPGDESFDAVLCLGHNFMSFVDPFETVAFLKRIRNRLKPGGVFVIDNIPGEFWPRMTEGDWTSGLSEDGAMQLVWAQDDNVFALRTGDEINEEDDKPREDETKYRLWTMGELRLIGHTTGFEVVVCDQPGVYIVFRRNNTSQ